MFDDPRYGREIRETLGVLWVVGAEAHLSPGIVTVELEDARRATVEYKLVEGSEEVTVVRFDVVADEPETTRQKINVAGRSFGVHHVGVSVGHDGKVLSVRTEIKEKMPSDYLQAIVVDQQQKDWREKLRTRVQGLLGGLNGSEAPVWRSVDDIVLENRNLFNSAAFGIFRQHLTTHVKLGWHLFAQNKMDLHQVAIREIALAKTLQQWGHHGEARKHLDRLFETVPRDKIRQRLDGVTADTALLVDYRVDQPAFGGTGSAERLQAGFEGVCLADHRAKFLWRMVVDELARGGQRRVEDRLHLYQDLTEKDPVCDANAHLVKTFSAAANRDVDAALHYVTAYRNQLEAVWRDHAELPYPAVHGLSSGLSFQAEMFHHFAPKRARPEVGRVLQRIRLFRAQAEILPQADGMPELESLRFILPELGEQSAMAPAPLSARGAWGERWSRDDLPALCEDLRTIVNEA